jgi:predicted secreted protein
MGWFTGVVVYILVWWVTLFAVLPFWVTPTEPEDVGHPAGAPQHPRLLRKAAVTSVIAAVIWLGIFIIVSEPWFSFRPG